MSKQVAESAQGGGISANQGSAATPPAPNQSAGVERHIAGPRAAGVFPVRTDPRVISPKGAAAPGARRNFANPLPPSRIHKIRDRQAARAIREATRAQFTGPIKQYCGLCKLWVNTGLKGKSNWDHHVSGSQHKSKERRNQGHWLDYCAFCPGKGPFTSKAQSEQHLQSKGHEENVWHAGPAFRTK